MKFEQLRPHQQKAIQLLRENWKAHRTHLVYGPVGMGKTATASYITGMFAEKGMRILFIAPYTVLVEQTAERFTEYGLPKCGIIWRDHPDTDPNAQIQIASAQTLERRQIPDVDLIIIDECHIRRTDLLAHIDSIETPVIGLSGTPYAPWLGKHYEALVKPCTMRELIDNGYLSEYEFYAPTKPDLSGCKLNNSSAWGKDYKEAEVAEIMGDAKLVGDIVSNWLERGKNLATICFAVDVLHANHLTNKFNNAGVKAEVMTAKTKKEERTKIIERFELGITKIVVNVGVLVAGFDSDVRCIIYARPTKSEMRWVQCLGRGMRKAEGKDKVLIFDHSGTVHQLGYPDQIEYDEIPQGKDKVKTDQERIKEEIEKLESLPKECHKCNYMKPPKQLECPRCGAIPLAGIDQDTDTSRQIESLKAQLKHEVTIQEKQNFYSELIGFIREMNAKGKNYKLGWAKHKFMEKFDHWPNGYHESPRATSPEVRNWIRSKNIAFAKSRSPEAVKARQEKLQEIYKQLDD